MRRVLDALGCGVAIGLVMVGCFIMIADGIEWLNRPGDPPAATPPKSAACVWSEPHEIVLQSDGGHLKYRFTGETCTLP